MTRERRASKPQTRVQRARGRVIEAAVSWRDAAQTSNYRRRDREMATQYRLFCRAMTTFARAIRAEERKPR